MTLSTPEAIDTALVAPFNPLFQDLAKIAKTPRRLIKKLAEDLSKDGLEDPCKEAVRIYSTLIPTAKELADLRAKTNKTLFKAKVKTKRLARHQETCQKISTKLAELIEKNPTLQSKLVHAALSLDHSNTNVHQALGRTKCEDGIWRQDDAIGWFSKSQEIAATRYQLLTAELEIQEITAPNWVRRSAGEQAKGFQIGDMQVCGLQDELVLHERVDSLYRTLQFIQYLETGDPANELDPLAHFCAGSSSKDFEAALKNLQEQQFVTFTDFKGQLLRKCARFGKVGVDKMSTESNWLLHVTAEASRSQVAGSYNPGWFSAGLANYAALSMGDPLERKELLALNASQTESGKDAKPTRSTALAREVDGPIFKLLSKGRLYGLSSLGFGSLDDFSPNDLAVATSMVEFLFVTGRGADFPQKLTEASRELRKQGSGGQILDWADLLTQAIGESPAELDKEWQAWLASSNTRSLLSSLREFK